MNSKNSVNVQASTVLWTMLEKVGKNSGNVAGIAKPIGLKEVQLRTVKRVDGILIGFLIYNIGMV